MLPNLSPPVDRSELAQQGLAYRSGDQAYNATVEASGIACSICMAGCSALFGPAKIACVAACNVTVCS